MAQLRREFKHWDDDAIHQEMSADTTPPPFEERQAQKAREQAATRAKQAERKHDAALLSRARVAAREEILLHEWGS
jgi:hypothetical protein